MILLGRFGRPKGIRGQIKLYPYSRSPEQLLNYQPWYLKDESGKWVPIKCTHVEINSQVLYITIEGIQDREKASQLTNREIAVSSDQLPTLPNGEFYWHQLIDLKVINQAGECLGKVVELMETGANDVLVVKSSDRKMPILIPFVMNIYIHQIDLVNQTIIVDWHEDYA